MIFMGKRRAKEGKDPVAQSLRHVTFIAVDCIHHELQSRVDNRAGLFGIEPFDERRRALEIGKQRGDGLALAISCPSCCHRCLFSQNAFRQMARGVAHWGLGTWNLERGTWNW